MFSFPPSSYLPEPKIEVSEDFLTASAGNLQAKLTVDSTQFDAGMKNSASHLDEFGNVIKQTKKKTKEFGEEIFRSRGALRLFAETTGSSLGVLRSLFESFELGGPILAGAVAALAVMKEGLDAQADMADKANEANKRYFETQKQIDEFITGKKPTRQQETLEAIGKTVDALKKEKEELRHIQGWGDLLYKTFAEVGTGITTLGGLLGKTYLDTALDRVDEINAEIRRKQSETATVRAEGPKGSEGGGGSSSIHAVSVGELGVFKVEHDAVEISLLQQIANNTKPHGSVIPPGGSFPVNSGPTSMVGLRGGGMVP